MSSVEGMKRAIVLQTEATSAKRKALNEASMRAVELANWLLSQRKSTFLMELHRATYLDSKANTSFCSQVICDIERFVCKNKGKNVERITMKFNIPRNCKVFKTKTKNFVELGIYPRKRIAIPIKENRNYQRFSSLLSSGWTCKTYGLAPDGQIVAYLSKETVIPNLPNVLGIDVNAKHFAVSVISPTGKVLYQTYFGRHIYARRRKIMERRAYLQSIGATKALLRLKNRERNFVETNLGQMIREIIKIAKCFHAEIAIENLKRFSPKGKRFNKIVMCIPFYKFKEILKSRCFDNDISLKIVDSWNTSKWCSHCGAIGKGHSSNYSLFKCKECKRVVNSDREASLAIAIKSLLERTNALNTHVQISNRRVPVSALFRRNDVGLDCNCVVHSYQPIESQRLLVVG